MDSLLILFVIDSTYHRIDISRSTGHCCGNSKYKVKLKYVVLLINSILDIKATYLFKFISIFPFTFIPQIPI